MFCISEPIANSKNKVYASHTPCFVLIVFYPVSGRVVRREGLLTHHFWRLRDTIITPVKTVTAASTFCQLSVSIPT